MQDPTRLAWIDLEMTGLDTQNDRIIEIATLVTDQSLELVAEGPVIAIHQSDAAISRMDEWNTRQHSGSGLVDRVRTSTHDESSAEQATLAFLREHLPDRASPMCGNSICQDRRFLARCMPDLEAFFHYRNLDVSTLKELCRRWAPGIAQRFVKNGSHLALDDIRDSVRELRFYKDNFLKFHS